MDKKDWRGQLDDLLTEYHSRAYCEVEGFVYDDDDRSTDEIQKEITNLVQQEIDRAREDTEVDRIKWALRELPKLTEGKDFREDNWSVIVEKLKTKLTK